TRCRTSEEVATTLAQAVLDDLAGVIDRKATCSDVTESGGVATYCRFTSWTTLTASQRTALDTCINAVWSDTATMMRSHSLWRSSGIWADLRYWLSLSPTVWAQEVPTRMVVSRVP
ncbi:MAG TPA: hypothetical protein VJ787_09005, partial [Thermoleophilia bacterium]|nr:hypothetical protein [Thermoleophilia bacterium]